MKRNDELQSSRVLGWIQKKRWLHGASTYLIQIECLQQLDSAIYRHWSVSCLLDGVLVYHKMTPSYFTKKGLKWRKNAKNADFGHHRIIHHFAIYWPKTYWKKDNASLNYLTFRRVLTASLAMPFLHDWLQWKWRGLRERRTPLPEITRPSYEHLS